MVNTHEPFPPSLDEALKSIPKYNPREEMRRALQSITSGGGASHEAEVEKRMLRQVLERGQANDSSTLFNGSQQPQPRHHPPAQGSSTSTLRAAAAPQESLVACLSSRLAKAEILARALRNQLAKRSRQLSEAKRQNALLLQALEDSRVSGDVMQGMCDLEQENASLRAQVHEFETFLSDYGLIWVGGSLDKGEADGLAGSEKGDTTALGERHQHQQQASSASSPSPPAPPPSPPSVDIPQLLHRIRELNRLLQMEGSLTTTTTTTKPVGGGGGAKRAAFQGTSTLPIAVYSNGILIRRGPFRPYSDDATKAFVRDILDGYFPFELKEQYPQGVMFELTDRSNEKHKHFVPFAGAGSAVGCSRVRTVQCLKDRRQLRLVDDALPMTAAEFFNRLPTQVVKGGQIVSVRDGIEKLLLGDHHTNHKCQVLETPTLNLIMQHSQQQGGACGEEEEGEEQQAGGGPPPPDISTLRILSADGGKSYLIKMRFTSTCLEVYQACDQGITTLPPDYELRTRYPSRALPRSAEETLESLGLIPNAILLIRETVRTEKGVGASTDKQQK